MQFAIAHGSRAYGNVNSTQQQKNTNAQREKKPPTQWNTKENENEILGPYSLIAGNVVSLYTANISLTSACDFDAYIGV